MDWVKEGKVEMSMLWMKMALTQLATHMTMEQMILTRFPKHILIIRYCRGPQFHVAITGSNFLMMDILTTKIS
jgi:hypothetical protein